MGDNSLFLSVFSASSHFFMVALDIKNKGDSGASHLIVAAFQLLDILGIDQMRPNTGEHVGRQTADSINNNSNDPIQHSVLKPDGSFHQGSQCLVVRKSCIDVRNVFFVE